MKVKGYMYPQIKKPVGILQVSITDLLKSYIPMRYKENELHFLYTRSCTMLFFVNIGPKKQNVFTVTCQKNLGSVGQD
jgi:hypothetical protein